jgi:hypothetical protein
MAIVKGNIPIGIVTFNRHRYLDVMLRSLSATVLPYTQSVTIFDDCSDARDSFLYLYSDKPVDLDAAWPADTDGWRRAGLETVTSRAVGCGPANKIQVVRIPKHCGVLRASCFAIAALARRATNGIILLQDDIVLTADWYVRLMLAAELSNDIAADERGDSTFVGTGMVAGMHVDRARAIDGWPGLAYAQHEPSACCLFITAAGVAHIMSVLHSTPMHTTGFDVFITKELQQAKLDCIVMRPGVAQHFGVRSIVRPDRPWTYMRGGRTDKGTPGPFVLGEQIRSFEPAT